MWYQRISHVLFNISTSGLFQAIEKCRRECNCVDKSARHNFTVPVPILVSKSRRLRGCRIGNFEEGLSMRETDVRPAVFENDVYFGKISPLIQVINHVSLLIEADSHLRVD